MELSDRVAKQSQSQLSKDRGEPSLITVAATPKCKEIAYCTQKGKKEVGGSDHQFFYHHTLHVGHNVVNALYNYVRAGKESRGLPSEKFCKCISYNTGKCPLASILKEQ